MCTAAQSLRKIKIDLSEDQLRDGLSAIFAKTPSGTIKDTAFLSVPATEPPWFDSGIDVQAGEELTVFTVGQSVLSQELGLLFYPDMQLWFRIGEEGQIFRGTRNSHSFTVAASGRLYFGNYFPGEWSTKTGAVAVGTEAYGQMQDGVIVTVVRWEGRPLDGLKQLLELGDVASLIASEIDRLEHGVEPPEGWEYLWFLGPSEMYSKGPAAPSDRPSIKCHTNRDAAILHKDVSVPLTRDTVLRWSWKVDSLPNDQAENTLENHDYVSIAVEFDNGQDLTFFWSSQLPKDAAFRCPIPTWTARETHVVARSGVEDLGVWCDEERPLYDYYERFIGSIGTPDPVFDPRVVPPPTKVVRVWLIANTMFKQNEGQCEYGAIELQSAGETHVVN